MSRALVFRIAVVAILIWLAVRYGNFTAMAAHFNAQLLLGVLAAQPLMFVGIALMTQRYAVLARTPPAPFFLTFKSMLLSIGFNTLLPGRISELLKVTYLRDHAGISATSGMAALFLERLTDVVILGLLALVSISLLVLDAGAMTVALLAVALISLFALFKFERPLVALAQRLPWTALRTWIVNFLSHLTGRVRDRLFLRAFLWGVAAWGVSWASVVVVVYFAGSIPIGFLGGLTVFVATSIGGAVPALPGGFGTYEAAGVVALKEFGYGFDEALAVALALHVSQFLGSLIAAFVIAFTERIGVVSFLRQTVTFMRAKK